MAKKFDTGGIKTLLGNSAKLEKAVQENPQEVVRELATAVALLPIEQIHANTGQPRQKFDKDALQELASSIEAHGIIQPITVRRLQDKEYQIISGERRFRASQLAGLTEIPAYVRIANDQELLEMALIENIQREDLNAWEVAISYGRLKDEFALTDEMLSTRVGKQRSTVTNYLRLLRFEGDEDIKRGLIEEKVSMGHARALAGVSDFALRNSLYHKIVSEDLSVRAVEALIASYQENKKGKESAPDKSLPPHLRDIQDKFNAFFGGKVQLKRDDKGKGQLVVSFKNDAELNRLIDLIEQD
ncbi:MAG TPA: ParB/RepB/Spo0J family partition protein [Saprospiraceae bacterium]|nr:ParB/RepB/Spo0J family partition protein [Saprospiraceae bacterium]HPI05484.1 ParB/RepB/Spo0J family partition protein [Saprospiraceae bacterium]